MDPKHWFLPRSPDVLAKLIEQTSVTVAGLDALTAWAGGESEAANRLRDLEHQGDERKRELRRALTEAFSTPLEPEDIFELSRGIDEILNEAKNLVAEAESMRTEPDPAMTKMAEELADGTKYLAEAIALIGRGQRTAATEVADRAVKQQRHLQHTYRKAMSALVAEQDLRELGARRELYRRLARSGDEMVRVAERVWYSVLKES